MNQQLAIKNLEVTRYIWLAVIFWTLTGIGLLVWNLWQIRQVTYQTAIADARANVNKDRAFHFWAAAHGGVYVFRDKNTPPNPYLNHIPERDIETSSGKKLTLMNPAYMVRQMNEEFTDLYGVMGHITSLNVLNPNNAPDEWERAALMAFGQGQTEVLEFTEISGEPYLRLIQPMMTQESCLKCHGHQGYEVGDIRGGIGVALPLTQLLTTERQINTVNILSLGLVWLLGLGGIVIVGRGLNSRIREQDRAEESLRESEKNLNKAQEIAHLGSWEWDVPTNDIHWSDEMYRIYDLEPGSKPTNKAIYKLIHPDDRAIFDRVMADSAVGQSSSAIEYRVIKADGQVRFVRRNAEMFYDESGNLRRVLGTVQDITKLKQAEETLRESEKRFYDLYENAPNAYFSVGADACIRMCNRCASELLRYPKEELIGKPVFDLYADTPQGKGKATQVFQHFLTGEAIFDEELQMQRSDGELVWVNLIVNVVRDVEGQIVESRSMAVDITKRKYTEEALRHNRDRFRQVVTSISDHIYVTAVNADGNKTNLYISPNIEGLTGYPLERFLDNWSFWAATVIHPDDRATAAKQVEKLARGEASVVEYRLVRADNEVIWVRDSGRLVEDNGFKTIYGVVGDVTKRKQANEEIRHRNRELTLLNQVIAASAESLETTAILETVCRELALAFEAPQAIAALLNKQKMAVEVVAEYVVEGRPAVLGSTIPVEGNPSVQYLLTRKIPLAIDDAQHDPRLAQVHHLIRQRGTVSILLLPLIIEEEVIGSLALDATEPRSFSVAEIDLAGSVAEQVSGVLDRVRLVQTRQLLNTAIEQITESVVITDVDGEIHYVNPAFEQISGYSQAEAVGKNPRILNSGKQNGAFYQDMWATITAGQVWQGQFINQKKDGTPYTEEATISPLRDKSGYISNYVAVKRDVTHELELAAQLRQAQKMEAVGRLAGGIAHDFNNLLTIIIGHSEFLLSRYPDVDDPRREEAEQIKMAGERAATLTQHLLTFSRRQPLQPQFLDLNQTVVNLKKMLPRLLGEDVNLITDLAPGLGQIKVDPSQIEQIIMNLAVNARDAMPRGGKLTIKTTLVDLDEANAKQHLDLTPGPYIMLTVADTGQGMDAETQNHIFEPFFTTKLVGKGTGLGLATVYGIVEQSGGHIQVDSTPGQGTTFKIYLPQVEQTGKIVSLPPAPTTPLAGQETILLVEDEAGVRLVTRKFLQKRGYTVLEAEHAEEALQLCQQYAEQIDLLITDVIMPDISGPELAGQLSQLQPTLKILYISGYADEVLKEYKTPNQDFILLEKPFSSDVLASKVRQMLDAS